MHTLPISNAYRNAIRVALAIQIPLAILLLLILDGGVLAKIGGYSIAGFWVGAGIVMFRRPRNPQPSDLIYIRWGYPCMLIVGMIITFVRQSQ